MKIGLALLAGGVAASFIGFAVAEWTGHAWDTAGPLADVGRAAVLVAIAGYAAAIVGAFRVIGR